MNSVISTHSQQKFKRPSLSHLSESSKLGLSKAEGSRIYSDEFQRLGVETDYSLKSDIMYNRGNKPGTNIGYAGDKANNRSTSGFQRHQSPTNSALAFDGGRDLVNGTTGLLLGSSQTGQQNSSALTAQTQALAQQQQQQLLRAQSKTNSLETFKMASNLQEQLLIKRQLESIKQELHQRKASKFRAELRIKAASHQVSPAGIGARGILSGAKHIPSTSNSSVVPTKQREDEMTKPDLSTLADTAVAVASATSARNSTGMLGMVGLNKMNSTNITGNNQIAALLGRRNPPSATSKESMQSSIARTNSAMTDMLRRDLGVTRGKLHVGQTFKRSLDEISKSPTAPSPASSSWLWKSGGLGNSATLSMAELRAQHEQQQRRNSLPARSSAPSDFESIRSMKRRKLIEEKVKEIERLEIQDAMKRVRQLDAKLDMRLHNIAEMASKIVSQERRASIASSAASVGTSATAPNLSTTSSAFISPVDRRSLINAESSLDERSKILEKLSRLSGGFPMPKSVNTAVGIQHNVPAEITPEVGKDVVDVMGRGSLSLKHQLETLKQPRLGGFPMPPLYMHNDDSQGSGSSKNGARGQFDGTMNVSESRSNNAISSHIRNNVNRGGAKITRPPTLESYKRVWRDIPVIAGDDPRVDERLRKEVFARKLQRGDIVVGRTGAIANNINNHFIQQRRLSDMSLASVTSGNTTGERTQVTDEKAEESIII